MHIWGVLPSHWFSVRTFATMPLALRGSPLARRPPAVTITRSPSNDKSSSVDNKGGNKRCADAISPSRRLPPPRDSPCDRARRELKKQLRTEVALVRRTRRLYGAHAPPGAHTRCSERTNSSSSSSSSSDDEDNLPSSSFHSTVARLGLASSARQVLSASSLASLLNATPAAHNEYRYDDEVAEIYAAAAARGRAASARVIRHPTAFWVALDSHTEQPDLDTALSHLETALQQDAELPKLW